MQIGKCSNTIMHVQLERLHLQDILSHKSFAQCFIKKKTENVSILIRHVTTEKRAKHIFMLQKGNG